MEFTVGMAIHCASDNEMEMARVRMTIMSLTIYHPHVTEIILVDNNPVDRPSHLEEFCKKVPMARYVPMADPIGTSAPRNRVFAEARNSHVVCIDPHVLPAPGCFAALAGFYGGRGHTCMDLVHGPMVNEAREVHSTHMNDQWRANMWGTWGRAWRTRDRQHLFSCMEPRKGLLRYVTIDIEPGTEQRFLTTEEVESYNLPDDLAWEGHEAKLRELGFNEPAAGAFKIPDHGMGLFCCRKDSWAELGFHPDARGFGGEEMSTGARFRRAGRSVWCVRGAEWWHDFGRCVTRAPYPMNLQDRIRNYILEFQRIGRDPAPIKKHFFTERSMPEGAWDALLTKIGVVSSNWTPARAAPAPAPAAVALRAAPEPVREKRWETCLACPHLNDAGTADMCRINNQQVIRLIRWADKRCPDNPPRWVESEPLTKETAGV